MINFFFFFSSRRRHTRSKRDWSSDVCSSDLIANTTADGSGNWSVRTSTLTQGTHSITATENVTDIAGNVSVASAALSVTIDTTAPGAPSTPDLIAASDTGSTSTDNITKATTPTFSGTAETNSTVTIFSARLAVVPILGSGNCTVRMTTSTLAQGRSTTTENATDIAGNVGLASAALSVTIDTTAPSAP